MQLNYILQQKLYLIVAIILAIFCLTIDFNSLGLNKTVGMAYDIDSIAKIICLVSLILSFIGYSILSSLSYQIQKVLSLLYLSDILLAIILSYTKQYEISIVFGLMLIMVSCINIIRSLKNKTNS
ncbi:hypothetical protein [Flavobacterium lindanitolerans]|uniref:Uncharacterized protein n=1 Tax=Flavobacterium lindanitolerans TaxID=428988 RepID=A0A497U4N1_9FLAO|nr:hypothetical protein [Flavobacterium lindanitolerans]MBC8643993.1 hypothetical protein [Flavobacterium lindanitolerans]PKW20216.1 hypothetical protein B0G92_2928 [Flavobacterium lindanitolerans]RLJ23825.1 hypothetical protein CLV50_3099 [Flavobacterium lindanitolerans]